MRKKLCIFLIAGATSVPVYAIENYIALELGSGSYDISGTLANSQIIKNLEDIGTYSIKGGHYFNDMLRVYLSFQQINSSETRFVSGSEVVATYEFNTRQYGIGADYLQYFSSQFYLLVGGNLDYYDSQFEINDNGELIDDNSTGLAFGANLGLGYKFTERFSMELGYRFTHYLDNETEDRTSLSFDGNQIGYLNASYSF
ncbi:outer membrane beta-barrel protein [Vibrio tetraodonis]|uniref:outer membrane beta-barrel protein n=1 Tax=Vibrio tetraodonis TaxID=2231647 RepID=UPI000E0AF17B|nr:outer membrane beta-barrel protein [Vibrio tetraodonis]